MELMMRLYKHDSFSLNATKTIHLNNFIKIFPITLPIKPGLKFEYSTFGNALLGHILASKSNMSYDQLLEERALNVLGMNSTSIVLSDTQKFRLAIGHLNGQELSFLNISRPIAPAGGLHSSVADMLKFASANVGLIDTKINKAIK